MRDDTRGMTLIELLIVMIVIGILAAIAIPKYTEMRNEAFYTTLTSDLRILVQQQAHYQSNNQVYTSDASSLTDMVPSEGVTVSINEVNGGTGWAATAVHQALEGEVCGIYYGDASAANAGPATRAGLISCSD